MEETQFTLELPKFKVDLENPTHKKYFREEENGQELDVLSIGQYIEKMPKMTQSNDSTILAAISRGLIPAITIKGNRNSFKLIVWCEASKSYEILNYRGPKSKGRKKIRFNND